jgi:large subunit ribosomal protein L7/L12
MQPTHEQIAARAYEIWRSKGGGHGHHAEDWYDAVHQLAPRTVVLTSVGDNKIGLIKELRAIAGLTLEQARDLAEGTPAPLLQGISAAEADNICRRLAAAGATVEVR